ncbi:MAG: DUF1178 family protein [Deltaproteobacteria bacterium]|nr:DUF1178 family protein [Deltaproteobacteria bacterium]
MIAFDMECSQGHLFEGWFDSNKSFEEQNAVGLVSCPYCDDIDIRKVMSPVAVKKSHTENKPARGGIDYQRLAREIVDYVQSNFEDVGPKFAAEALKMHYGVGEKRNIKGSATVEEEETLRDEGIDFFKVPMPEIEDDEKKN